MPILALFESIRKRSMDLFAERHQIKLTTPGILVKKVATQIQDLVNTRARRYRFIHRQGLHYEVTSKETLQDYLVCYFSHTFTSGS